MKRPLEIEIINYEKPIKELIGKTVSDVHYYKIDYGKPSWNKNEFHSLDYGMEITMLDRNTYYFTWGNTFTQYDLKFGKGNISFEFNAEIRATNYNAKNNSYWAELIGKKIIGIKSFWTYWTLAEDEKRNYYPQDVRIDFDNGKAIWISALEIEEDSIIGMQDHLTIIFDKPTAGKYKVGAKTIDTD